MDADDVQRLLTQIRLRCLLLEADKDAEILRAGKYRKILGRLADEDGATADNFHRSRLRALVERRAKARCEYCRAPQRV